MASPSRVGQRRPTACRQLGPRRVLRRTASLPSWYTPGRTGPGPLAGAPGLLPLVSGYWCPFVVRTHSTVHPEGDNPIPYTIRKNAREWQRLWRGGDIITEVDGDDPGMPRRAQAHRLIETYGYSGPREPAVDRLTTAELFIFDAPRRDRL